MIATILPGSTNFHAVGYNEHKVSKGVARLIEIQNFGSLGTFHKPTPSELVGYLQKYSSQNSRIRKPQFHVAISCKGHEMSEDELLDFAHSSSAANCRCNTPCLSLSSLILFPNNIMLCLSFDIILIYYSLVSSNSDGISFEELNPSICFD